jgi:hypothetical protein
MEYKRPQLREVEGELSIEELMSKFNVEPLAKKIEELLGVDVDLKWEIEEHPRAGLRLKLSSRELIDDAGVFRAALKSVHLGEFNSKISTKDGQTTSWSTIYLQYEHLEGGSNGAEVLSASFNFNSGVWKFRTPDGKVS